MRSFVRSRVGARHLVPLLHETRSPSRIPFDRLEPPYVIKPTHASGVVYIVREGESLDAERRRAIVEDLYWYLENHSGFPYGIWPWYDADPRVVVERLLVTGNGEVPTDYKIHCFDGKPHFVQVHGDRFSDHHCSIYDPDFERVPVEIRHPVRDFQRPENLAGLLEVASELSAGLDYIRVDLYDVGGTVYFGEMTPYDAAGLKCLEPSWWDVAWGRRWTLPAREGRGPGRVDEQFEAPSSRQTSMP